MAERIILGSPRGQGNQFSMARHAPEGLARNSPIVGLAAMMHASGKETRTEVEPEPKPLTKKPTLSNTGSVDKEHSRNAGREASRRHLIQMAVGRRVDLSKRGNRWSAFQDELRNRNGGLFTVVQAEHLGLQFISDDLMEDMVAKRFDGLPKSRGKENVAIRNLMNEMNDFSRQRQAEDMRREQRLLQAYPNLHQLVMERMRDPDNPKWFIAGGANPEFPIRQDEYGFAELDVDGNEQYDFSNWIPRDQVSAWLPASFHVARVGSSAPNRVSLEFEDTSQVLHNAREQWVDALESRFGFDTEAVSVYWKPQMDIMETIGGRRNISDVRFSIPPIPYDTPLKSPQTWETKSN